MNGSFPTEFMKVSHVTKGTRKVIITFFCSEIEGRTKNKTTLPLPLPNKTYKQRALTNLVYSFQF